MKAPKSEVPAPISAITKTRCLLSSGLIAAAATAVASGTKPRSMQSFGAAVRISLACRLAAGSLTRLTAFRADSASSTGRPLLVS